MVPTPATAQVVAPGYVHDAWTNADGLPVNTVNAMVEDHAGYLWLATFDGLIRFDGHAFTIFNTSNTPGLPNNRIGDLFLSADGRLWFSTGDGSLASWQQGQVTLLDPERFGQARVRPLAQAADGTLWLNTTTGIFCLQDGEFRHIWHDPRHSFNTRIYPMRDGSVWVTPNDEHAAALYVTAHDTTHFSLDQLGEVFDVYDDPLEAGVSWLSTSKGGFRYAAGHGTWVTALGAERKFFRDANGQRYVGTTHELYRLGGDGPTRLFTGRLQSTLGSAYWRALQINNGQEWMAGPDRVLHDGRTVFLLDEAQTEIRQVLEDHEGNVWIATLREGLHRLRPSLFTTYGMEEGLASANVYAIREAAPGTMWIGTQGGGVARLQADTVRVWQRPEGVPYLVYDVLPDRNGGLWVSGGMLAHSTSRLNPVFTPDFASQLGISESIANIRALYEDHRGCLWIGSEFVLYRLCNGIPERFTTDAGLTSSKVVAFRETPDGTLWMATTGGGLMAYRDGRFHALTTADGLSSNNVRALYQDADGILWVGTGDQGLNRIVLRDDHPTQAAHITVYRAVDGLFADGIHVILEDDAGRIWMSTNRGIFWVTREGLNAFAEGRERRIFSISYDESDGLRDREANGGTQSPGLKASDGRLWFATQDGAVVIDPADVHPAVTPVPTYIEAITADTLSLPWPSPSLAPSAAAPVRLPLGVRNFNVRYTGIHFTKPRSVRYRYRLGSEAWTEAGTRRTAFFTNVPPGTYSFEVAASVYPGQWPSQGTRVTLTVPPFFYETGWFRALAVLLVGALLAGAYRGRVQAHRRRERMLNALVKTRTSEVRQEKARAEEALRQVQVQAEQLRSLDAAKSRFFANISHEFRTPLTLTLGPLEDLEDGAFGEFSEAAREQIALAHRNAQRLLRLINQLLDLSRLESGTIRLNRQPVPVAPMVRGIAGAFAALAERKSICFEMHIPRDPVVIDGDPERLEEIFVNLIGNAFKFTPEGGRITVDVAPEHARERVVITVEDTGTGIDPEDLPHVFDRFFQGKRGQDLATPGTGIGLALSKELVDLHGGTLSVESTPGEGSTFTVVLPLLASEQAGADVEGDGEAMYASAVTGPWAPILLAESLANGKGTVLPDAVPDAVPAETASEEAAGDRTTVLVVDDHADIRAYVRRHLEPTYRVLEASGGVEGLELVNRHLPDLVVSDVMMPGFDGYALCRALRADPALAFIPVILLTGRAGTEDKLAGLQEGADGYLTKPFDVRELRARIDNLIKQRQRLRETLAQTVMAAPVEASKTETSDHEALLARVHEIVQTRLADETLTVETLAEAVGLSRSQLYRRLKAADGQTPADLIREARLAEAARLLARKAGTVSEVAYGVGFNSIAHFSRTFRAAYGVPPSEYAETE